MKGRPLFALAIAALPCAVLALPGEATLAYADAAARAGDGGSRRDPNNVTGISDAMEAVVAGNARYMAKDFPGAIEKYQRAIQLQPRWPLGYLVMGEALLAQGKLDEADQAWKKGDDVASGTPQVKAKLLFCIADLRERQKKWEEAKAAWQRYVEYANANDAGAFPASGTARISAIDAMLKQDKAYEIVRQRIAEERDGGADASR